MKFRIIALGYRSLPDYPYNYRIELVQYNSFEYEELTKWLRDLEIPHTRLHRGTVFYLREEDAMNFKLRWI